MGNMPGTSSFLIDRDGPPGPVLGGELADLALESVIVYDLGGVIRYWNPASETLYGCPTLAAVGRDISEFSINDTLHDKQWHLLLREGIWKGSLQRCTSSGYHVTVAVRQTVRCDAEGRPRDIVEYGRRAQTDPNRVAAWSEDGDHCVAACWKLDTSRVRPLLDAIAALKDRGIAADSRWPSGWAEDLLTGIRIVDVNERTVHLVGAYAGRDQMIGQSVALFWPLQSRTDLADLIATVAADGSQHVSRMRKITSLLLRDPTMTVWRSTKREESDIVFVAVSGAADRSFWSLRASEERYRKLIHYMPVALWQVDARSMGSVFGKLKAEGVNDLDAYLNDHPELIGFANETVRVTDVNRSAVLLFGGSSPAEFIKPVGYLFAASPETARRVMTARFDGRRNHAEIMKVQTFDGRVLDVQLSVTYPTPPEELDLTIISMEDITDRLCTEAQLRQLQTDFTRAARISMLGELATSIAHEVKQPLAAIVTNGETSLRWLSRDEPNLAKVKQLTARIVASADRANNIIQRIREMAEKHEPEHIPLDLNDVVNEALLFIRHDIKSLSIDLSANLSAGLPHVMGDRIQLQQVIINLLVNSVQAIAQGGGSTRRIDIRTAADHGKTVSFSVHDSGPGILQDELNRIFDSFYTTKDSGIGIGLAICQSIIFGHGGSITASNNPDGGAQFEFSLPLGPTAERV